MKRIFGLVFSLSLLAFSCAKNNAEGEQQAEQGSNDPQIPLSVNSKLLHYGESFTLRAEPQFEDKTVLWTTSDESVAGLGETSGQQEVTVSAGKDGRAVITASPLGHPGLKSTCVVTVSTKKVQSISFDRQPGRDYLLLLRNPSNIMYDDLRFHDLNVRVLPEDASIPEISYSTTNSSIAYVNADGTVLPGNHDGVAIITLSARDGSGVKATIEVRVQEDYIVPTSLSSFAAQLGNVAKGDSKTVSLSWFPANATETDFKVTSSEPAVATVVKNEDGTFTLNALSEGTSTISVAALKGTAHASATVNVVDGTPYLTLTWPEDYYYAEPFVSADRLNVVVGQNIKLTAMAFNTSASVNWSTDSYSRVSVSANGTLTCKAVSDDVTITASLSGNESVSKSVKVRCYAAPTNLALKFYKQFSAVPEYEIPATSTYYLLTGSDYGENGIYVTVTLSDGTSPQRVRQKRVKAELDAAIAPYVSVTESKRILGYDGSTVYGTKWNVKCTKRPASTVTGNISFYDADFPTVKRSFKVGVN